MAYIPSYPQQRLPSPSRSSSLLLHLIGLSSFLASFKYLDNQYDVPIAQAYGGYFQFLTILGLGASTATFAIGVLADLSLNSSLFSFKNSLAVVTAPVEILVAIMYWSIYAYDHRLLFPTEFMLPLIPDIGFHAMPGIMLGLDLLLFSPPSTIPPWLMLAISNVLAFMYWAWVEYCYSHNGWYPYPMFHMLSTFYRSLLFAFGALLMTGSTMALRWVYSKMNGAPNRQNEAAVVKPTKGE